MFIILLWSPLWQDPFGKDTGINAFLYRAYAVHLARKHTPFSNREIGKYFDGIPCSAVTKIGTRFKERMRDNKRLKDEAGGLEEKLSCVSSRAQAQ